MKRHAQLKLEGWNAGRLEGWTRAPLGCLACGVLWIGATSHLLACPVCFQVEEGPVTAGARAAVLVLIGVTLGVLAGFGVFVGRFVARSNAMKPGSEGAATAEERPVLPCR